MSVGRFTLVLIAVALGAGSAEAATCEGMNGGPGDLDGDGFIQSIDCDDSIVATWATPGPVENVRFLGGPSSTPSSGTRRPIPAPRRRCSTTSSARRARSLLPPIASIRSTCNRKRISNHRSPVSPFITWSWLAATAETATP